MTKKIVKQKKESVNMEKLKLEAKVSLRTTTFIILGVLGFLNTIGIYWGREGFEKLGIGILMGIAMLFFLLINGVFDK